MVNKLLIILLTLFLAGCATPLPKVVYKTTYVPYYIIVKIPVIKKPKLAIYSLTKSEATNPAILGPAYVESFREVLNYANILSYEIIYHNCLADNYNYNMTNYMNFDNTLNGIINNYNNTKTQLISSLQMSYNLKCKK